MKTASEGGPAATTAILDFDKFRATPLATDPFDHIIVPDFVRPDAVPALIAAYPEIDAPGVKKPEEVTYGPAFAGLLEAISGPEMAEAFGEKFDLDLSDCEPQIQIRRFSEPTDGNIHTDHVSKLITLLIYFNEEWPHEGGRLRLLRSLTDMEDYAVESPPIAGTLLAFRRTDNSYHGHKPHDGQRRMLQMSYVQHTAATRAQRHISRMTKPLRRALNMS